MATNKKITQLDELTPATWADDDVIAIVDISAQETKKIQLSTFRGAVTGVSSLNANTPLTVDSATGDVTISVAIDGGGTINAVFDEDNMASNSPTALATQQSIKAYVDSQVGTVDTLAEILANGNTSGGTNIVVSSGDVITTNTINETTAAAGVTIDSVLVKDGQVDGRDVSVDGTKLDTVETNADVTDTTNVTAAGALMDSELTNITAVKALNQGVATTDTPTFAGLVTAGNVDGRDVSVDGAKLDGIEAGADVTDATNVTAAGALMDSELTNIAAVKALDQGVATGDSPSFAGLTATTADINGGTIDGTVIGASSAAAGTFTTFTSTGIDDNATSTALTISSSDNVGIGTASPVAKLHSSVSSSGASLAGGVNIAAFLEAATNTTLQISAGTGSTAYINLGDAADIDAFRLAAQNGFSQIAASGASDYLRFDVGGFVERMRITSSGNVGIGTTAPAQELHVVGKTRIQRSTNANLEITSDNNTGANPFVIGTNSDAFFLKNQAASGFGTGGNFIEYAEGGSLRLMGADYIDTSGNVGINTTPSYRLHISNGSSTGTAMQLQTTGSGHNFDMVDGTGTARFRNVNGEMRLYGDLNSGGNGNIVFLPQGTTERMRIDSSGNVGIGTSAASTKVEISTNNETSVLRLTDTATIGAVDRKVGGVEFYQNDASGGAGIGSSIEAYHVNISGDTDLRFATGDNSEAMRIDSSGNVGIGTSPATELDMTDGTLRTKYVQGGYGNINGNFHADAKTGTAGIFYMNWFAGSGGASVGNGASGYGTIRASAFTVSSDRRLKENISYFDSGLDKILQLKPATFDFINGENNQKGFIAQDVETVIPEVVGTTTMPDSDGIVDESDTYLTINSSAMIPYLVAAIQEQQASIEALEARIVALETA